MSFWVLLSPPPTSPQCWEYSHTCYTSHCYVDSGDSEFGSSRLCDKSVTLRLSPTYPQSSIGDWDFTRMCSMLVHAHTHTHTSPFRDGGGPGWTNTEAKPSSRQSPDLNVPPGSGEFPPSFCFLPMTYRSGSLLKGEVTGGKKPFPILVCGVCPLRMK